MLKLFNMTVKKIKQKVQIVVTSKDSILLLKLNNERGGFWQNATGSVEVGESFQAAAERELFEETGIQMPLKILPMEIKFHDRWGYDVIEKIFHCPLNSNFTIKLSDEHQDFKWKKFNDLALSDYQYDNHFKAALLAKEKDK